MKISEIKYERMNFEEYKEVLNRIILQVKSAKNVEEVLETIEVFKDYGKRFYTSASLVFIRYTQNTTDEFYLKEKEYIDEIEPEISNLINEYQRAILESPHRKEIDKKLSPVLIKNLEINIKSMSSEIIEDLVEENKLVNRYSQLMAGMLIEFRGEKMPKTLLGKYLFSDDRETRKEAFNAYGKTLKENSEELDEIFDSLVKVRDRMAKKMGYKNFVELGYYRMGRIDYNEEMVKKFRENVLKDIVPVVTRLKQEVAKDMGIDKWMLYDDNISIKGGNPKPCKDTEGILNAAKEMYTEMGPITADFINLMMDNEAFDVVSRPNKYGGGYCSNLIDYKQPFILANFNGTADDVNVVTHEAGHALADYLIADNEYAFELGVGGMETAETHSMSMEFLSWKYMDKFFGESTDKYKYIHCLDAISFIPYGTIVDYFQHIIYENPEMTPAERKEVWNKLESEYRPYISTEDMIYLEEGTRWQYQMHIYESPFYYIDYCLAQLVALQFLTESMKDYEGAFKKYLHFASQGGEKLFSSLVKEAGLKSPFEEGALQTLSSDIEKVINDLKTKIAL